MFVTPLATLYLIRDSRGFDVAAEALGENYSGALVHDGWAPYDRFKRATHGQCIAHLLRRCDHLLETALAGAARSLFLIAQAFCFSSALTGSGSDNSGGSSE